MLLTFHKERVMGNQPSSPASAPAPAPAPPPLTITCDAQCQRDKNLALLKSEMDSAKGTPQYEPARVKYYTLLEGQGWLAKEKERIAKDDLDSKIKQYTSQYETLKSQQKIQSTYSNLVSAFKAEEAQNEEQNKQITKQIGSVESQTAILNRLSQLSPVPSGFSISTYLPIILDVLIGILSLVVLYMLYSKFMVSSEPVEQIAGRRFSRRV